MTTDIFAARVLKPMLIQNEVEPFDNRDYLFELKLDGTRCLAYIDPVTETVALRNKRSMVLEPKFPELNGVWRQVTHNCVLDGELIVAGQDGAPNFREIQRRSIMTNHFKIEQAAAQLPASFVAFDILYFDGTMVTERPLIERKELLRQTVVEDARLAVSRFIVGEGKALYQLTIDRGLEGIVAKPLSGQYFPNTTSKAWLKIKNLQDDDFVICGYFLSEKLKPVILLAQYNQDGNLCYRGHVSGLSRTEFVAVEAQEPGAPLVQDMEHVHWLKPRLVCTVKHMGWTPRGHMRQPAFKGLREDKIAEECGFKGS